MSELDAWNTVTINPAQLLHLDDRTGSIKVGKDADVVLWSDHPLSIYAKAEKTIIEGRVFFDLEEDQKKRTAIKEERGKLIQMMLTEKLNGGELQSPQKKVLKNLLATPNKTKIMKKQCIYHLIAFFLTGSLVAQQTPAPKQTKAFTIVGATAHIGNGKVIENSLIIFRDGKLVYVGTSMVKRMYEGTIIDAKGKHVYPGFIAANASLGLAEVDAVRATRDVDEVGPMLPHAAVLSLTTQKAK